MPMYFCDLMPHFRGTVCYLDGESEAHRYGYANFEAFLTSDHMTDLIEVQYDEGRPVFFRALPKANNRAHYNDMIRSRKVAERKAM